MWTCISTRGNDCRKLYVIEVFFFWKIFVTYQITNIKLSKIKPSLHTRKSNVLAGADKTYHQQVVEEKHLSLMYTSALWSVGVRHLIKLAAAHKPAVGKWQDLQNEKSVRSSATDVALLTLTLMDEMNLQEIMSKNMYTLVSCPRWLSPQLGPGRHGHHWSSVPTSECAGRSPPASHVGYPVHYLLLKDTGHLLLELLLNILFYFQTCL